MLKEAIEKIQEMSKATIREIEGRSFHITSDGANEIRPSIDMAATLDLTSLDAMVKMVRTEANKLYRAPFYITIPNHKTVDCFAQPDADARYARQTFYRARATDVPGWSENEKLTFEGALIALRTRFQPTKDTEYVLRLLSEISTSAKITFNDNGIATSVVTKKGIDLQANEPIRPVVSLNPYRTFQELDQPTSQFLIRVSERTISFIEADGGMWKLAARKTIQAYFNEALAEEVHNGTVIIAL